MLALKVTTVGASAWVTARLFLADDGCRLRFDPADAVRLMEAVAAGRLDPGQIAAWFRARLDA